MCCLNLKIFDRLDMQSNKSKILQRSSVKNMWKYILIGLGTVILEWIFLSAFSPWFNGMGELGGIIISVGFFVAFEMVICTGAIISKINANKDK